MDCTRVEELLALFSGGDLDVRQTETVRAHLVVCPTCQMQADAMAADRAWLQAAPPPQFDEAFYAGLRQSVLRELPQVELKGGRFAWLAGWLPQWRWQPVLALAATGLLLFVGWAVYRKSVSQPNGIRSREVVINPAPTMMPEQKKDLAFQPPDAPAPRSRENLNRSLSRTDKALKRQPIPPQLPALPDDRTVALIAQANLQNFGTANPAPVPEPEMTRIEFQTADPNIRIIWFAPKPDTAAADAK